MRSFLVGVLLLISACGGPPCRLQEDCPIGYYCILDVPTSGRAQGSCVRDCAVAADCEQPTSNASRAICTNEGRCRVQSRPPRLRVLEPEVDAIYPEGTRRIRVSGEVQSASERVVVRANSRMREGCGGGGQRTLTLDNPTPGEFAVLPFVIDDLVVDPGLHTLDVSASVDGSEQRAVIDFEVPCPGCAQITITRPAPSDGAPGLELGALSGNVTPLVRSAVWRIHGARGALFDGRLPINSDSAFYLERLPLFPGQNRVEVVVTGVGSGLGEARCSTLVFSGVGFEPGYRMLLSWDSQADLDLHLIGPGGRYGDLASSLSPRSAQPLFGGTVVDDSDGYGPETMSLADPADGVWGLVVEPVFDAGGQGASAFLRLLYEGSLVTGAVGPQYVSADRGELWVVGTLTKSGNSVTFAPVNQVISANLPPTTPPELWPVLY